MNEVATRVVLRVWNLLIDSINLVCFCRCRKKNSFTYDSVIDDAFGSRVTSNEVENIYADKVENKRFFLI